MMNKETFVYQNSTWSEKVPFRVRLVESQCHGINRATSYPSSSELSETSGGARCDVCELQ